MDCIELEIVKVEAGKNSQVELLKKLKAQVELLKKLKVGNQYSKNSITKKVISIENDSIIYTVSFGNIKMFDDYLKYRTTINKFYKSCSSWELLEK